MVTGSSISPQTYDKASYGLGDDLCHCDHCESCSICPNTMSVSDPGCKINSRISESSRGRYWSLELSYFNISMLSNENVGHLKEENGGCLQLLGRKHDFERLARQFSTSTQRRRNKTVELGKGTPKRCTGAWSSMLYRRPCGDMTCVPLNDDESLVASC